jgi:hypothetical protein
VRPIADAQRAPEVALDEGDVRVGEQRAEQAEREALVDQAVQRLSLSSTAAACRRPRARGG